MGRKRNIDENKIKGPGRKTRKQKDPEEFNNFKSNDLLKKRKRQKVKGKNTKHTEIALLQNEEPDSPKLLPIEKKALKLLEEKTQNDNLAEQEMQMNIADSEAYVLPSGEEIEIDETSLVIIKQRIADVLQVLGDFKKRVEPGKRRKDYINQLLKDLCSCYGYNPFLISKFWELFPHEIIEFLEASNSLRPETIRTNTLKTRRRDLAKALIARGVNLDPVQWSKVGLVILDIKRTKDHNVTIGATPEYLAGQYMLQGASSFLPCISLAPQENELILDMAAAPGGKTTYLAQLMRNTGCIVANDANSDRVKAIVGNVHRMGVINCIISCMDGRKLKKTMSNFDRILLDAPCTGTGVISKHQNVKVSKTEKDVQRCSHLQRELLLSAIDSCNAKSTTGGFIVYSTCSVLVEENEEVVNYALKKRCVKVVESGLTFGVDGFARFKEHHFHPSLRLSKRFYPHTHNLDGFFVCKLKKFSNIIPGTKKAKVTEEAQQEIQTD